MDSREWSMDLIMGLIMRVSRAWAVTIEWKRKEKETFYQNKASKFVSVADVRSLNLHSTFWALPYHNCWWPFYCRRGPNFLFFFVFFFFDGKPFPLFFFPRNWHKLLLFPKIESYMFLHFCGLGSAVDSSFMNFCKKCCQVSYSSIFINY